MMVRVLVYLAVFWAMQVAAQVFFKWGSGSESRFVWGFLTGNVFGFSSIWLLMLLYKALHPNVALGVAVGGSFLLSQVAVALVFRSSVTPMQWVGIVAIMAGMAALAGGTRSMHTGSAPTTSTFVSHLDADVPEAVARQGDTTVSEHRQ